MEIIRDFLVFIAAMFAMCIVLVVVVSNLPDQNPLKRILTALSYRVGHSPRLGVPMPLARAGPNACHAEDKKADHSLVDHLAQLA